jgi:hypothetical protein
MIGVLCLETGKTALYFANTGMEAIQKALYTANVSKLDRTAKIEATGKDGRTLTFTHDGKTYSTLANGTYQG